jgi:Fe-S-cluster containining protein
MENLNLQEFDLAFFNDGYRIAGECFDGGITRLSLMDMTRKVYDYIDVFIEQFLEQCNCSNSRVDCKKGCASCCHQSVFVLPHEAFYLYMYLKTQGNNILYNTLRDEVLKKNEVTSEMDLKSILYNTQPCPFLDNNNCLVYDARPMACRLFLSMDLQSCITERRNPVNMNKYARLYEIPLRAGRMLNEGICAWFTEKGVKSTEWIIESSLGLLFRDEKVIYHWIKGAESFKSRELKDGEWALFKKFDGG